MNYFEDPKNVGMAFILCAILSLIFAVYGIVVGLTGEFMEEDSARSTVMAIGFVIAAFIYFRFGKELRTGAFSGKMDVLGNTVKTTGIAFLLIGLLSTVGGLFVGVFTGGVGYILLSIVFIWASKKMIDGNAAATGKIVWIMLVLFSVIGVLMSLFAIMIIVELLPGICGLIISMMILTYALDPEIKKQMGM